MSQHSNVLFINFIDPYWPWPGRKKYARYVPSSYAIINLKMWKTLPKKLTQKLSHWLYFKQLKLLSCLYRYSKKNASPSYPFMEQSFAASGWIVEKSKRKKQKKHKQTTSIYKVISTEFLFSRHMTNSSRLIFDFKVRYEDRASRWPLDIYLFYFTDPRAEKNSVYLNEGV